MLEFEALPIQTWVRCSKKVSDSVSWYNCWEWACAMLWCFTFAQAAIWWTDFVGLFGWDFFYPSISFQPDQVHNCSSLCGYIKVCTAYISEWSGTEQTVRGGEDCLFFRMLFIACCGGSCSKMFMRIQIHSKGLCRVQFCCRWICW